MRNLVLILLLSLCASAQKKPITLDTLQGGRGGGRGGFAAPPTWLPDGKTFAFRQGRSIMLYDPATKSSKPLIDTTPIDAAAVSPAAEEGPTDWTNRRARIAGLQFSRDAKLLLYSAGGDLFAIHTATGKWDQLTKTPVPELDAKLSPDARMVAFRRGWDLYTIDIASGKETRLTGNGTETLRNGVPDWVYPEELELGTGFWWAPDSKSLCYLQFDSSREPVFPHADMLGTRAFAEPERYPQAGENNPDVRLGVVPAAGGPTRWLEVGETRDTYLIARAGWMPGSRAVYILRMNRVQNKLEMLSIDVESREAASVFKESDPYWINLVGDIQFLDDGKRFLWTSQRDGGFRHIFLSSNDGKTVRQLTRGPWEVTAINGVDEAAGRLWYTSSEPTPLERHLYSIGLDGAAKHQLTAANFTHNVSMSPNGAYYLDTYSNLSAPPRTTLHSGDGKELGVYREADRTQADEYDIRPTEIVRFKGPDGSDFYGRLIKPANFEPGRKYPVIVDVYGGPGVGDPVRNAWSGLSLDQVWAHKGYVVWQCENRGIMGRGHNFETAIYHQLGVTELADQVAGVKYLISLGFADPARIGITGSSYGGFMTINAMLNAPDVFKAGAGGAPVTNFVNYDTIYTERYMGLPRDNPDGYKLTELPLHAANLTGRLLIYHNFEDDNVLFQNTLQITSALQQAGKQFELMLYPQKTHGVTGVYSRQLQQLVVDFFDRALK
ncbi:MAG TPA: DPP IV N-terminal domain-containing protein [Candidatus Acidoferrales bacterium]|nr:DPP IV N-terminal domain-containing protein [Candidatus Acidoferrales bacterium]